MGADICGELPELSETDAEMSTGVPLLSAVGSKTEDVTACIACGKWIKISKNRREHDLDYTMPTV